MVRVHRWLEGYDGSRQGSAFYAALFTAFGAFVALAATHNFADTLFNLRYELVVALVGAETALFWVAIVACVGPLRQATSADPVEILRAG